MKRILIGILLFAVAGCISPQIPAGKPEEYELPGLNNTTIFYLNVTSVQVVENVVNATSANFLIGDSSELNIKNPVAVDYSGKNVAFNVSKEVIMGKSYARYDFNSPFSGFVAFTQSDGNQLRRALVKNGSVRVVLPENFTTGFVFLGAAQPAPDNITFDESGREILTWENPYPQHKALSVKYYHESAPANLFYLLIILVGAAALISVYYYFSLKKLREKYGWIKK